MNKIQICDRCIGEEEPCFIVAEAGVNHNGDIKLAKKLVDAAKDVGADAIKFQTWKTENIKVRDSKMAPYQRKNLGYEESQFEMSKKYELPYSAFSELKDYAEEEGLIIFSTAEDEESINFLNSVNIPVFKIPSGDLTNLPLLKFTAKKNRPIILSTGMGYLSEVDEAVRTILDTGNKEIIILHATSNYPAQYFELNLKCLTTLSKAFNTIIGYSDHTLSIDVPIAAISLGAKVIEKHLTLDRGLKGPDHKASIKPDEFKLMVETIRSIENALGDGIKRPSDSEMEIRKFVRKIMVAKKDVKKGELIKEEHIACKRAGEGLSPTMIKYLIGKRARFDLSKDRPISLRGVE